jgi:CRISPR-associated protein Cas1
MHQSAVLEYSGQEEKARRIKLYAADVQSGDPKNREASGAKIYWKALFGKDFLRSPEGLWPNALLNYGYALLRGTAARAVCAAGLSPVFGIHHENGTNLFPLADDLMEPYRPLVDFHVRQAVDAGITELNPSSKQSISAFFWDDLDGENEVTPFFAAMERMLFSLVMSLKTGKPRLKIAGLMLAKNDTTQLV